MNHSGARWISYSLQKFLSAAGPIRRWVTVTGTGPSYQPGADIKLNAGSFKAWYPSNSIQTFEIQNVDLNPPATPTNVSAWAGSNYGKSGFGFNSAFRNM
ncbi:MAG TPA: hypothetical protein VG347_11890 [Verrucomicrobiae bacterium]|nr:hypothetical protein [Verrucomicrobiae bacterium]